MCFPDLSVTNDPQMNKNYDFIDNRVKKTNKQAQKTTKNQFSTEGHLSISFGGKHLQFAVMEHCEEKLYRDGTTLQAYTPVFALPCFPNRSHIQFYSSFSVLIKILSRTSELFFFFHGTYLQIILPLDLLWQGLICSEQAIAFHISGWHLLISRTGIFINGILILPFSQSFMSFMAPWSDCELQLLKSSVGLKRKS